jgi:alkaline phosphatase D
MTLTIDRRSLVKGGAFGLGALLLPGGAAALAQLAAARGFTHNVASGEPSQDSVLLWTRYVPSQGASAHVHAEVSDTADFRRIVAGGAVITGPWRDWTVKVTVAGLEPGRPYFYRFTSNGEVSPIGRTRTLPEGRVPEWRMAVFSCANLPFGYFNAYAHAAARDDLHLGLHLGDYLYEYKRGTYPSEREAVAARVLEPANELIHLADYRTRYACYRADPDLQALHSRLAIIPSVDDHETANDSWEGGAENHNTGEGDYTERKIAAMQAWREWMPVSDEPYATYEFGDLGTYFRTETRTIGRSQAPSLEAALKGAADPVAALKAFRDGDWADPARSMMGSTQEHWLADGLHRSVRSRKRWQVVGVGTIVGRQVAPPEAANWISPDAPDYITTRVKAALLAAKLGLPSDLESWGGFPAARARLLQSAQSADADLVILAGDSHNAWGFELSQDSKRAAVEFDGHSVTSPGYESFFRQVPPTNISSALVRANPELKWCSTAGRGYMTVTLTPEAASSEWLFMDTVIGRSTQVGRTHRMHTRAGRRMLEAA